MNLLELKYFMDAAKYENFSKAAKINQVPPSSISKAIKNLEKRYETPLFDRNGRNIFLNERGKYLYSQARDIFQKLEDCNDFFANVRSNNIVVYTQDIAFLVPLLCMDFMYRHPQTNIAFTTYSEVSHSTRSPYDITFMHILDDMKPYCYEKVMSDDMVLLVSKEHPLAAFDEIDVSMLKNERFIGFFKTMSLRTLADSICTQFGDFYPWYVFETHDELCVIYFVASNYGLALFPEKLYNVYPNEKIKPVRLKQTLTNDTAIAWASDKKLSRAEEEFLAYTHQWFLEKKLTT